MILSAEDLIEQAKELHPDKMILDDCPDFLRGKLAGKVELILELEEILNKVQEQEEEEDMDDDSTRY